MATQNTFAPQSNFSPSIKPLPPGSSIIVIGAGAFGGWTALYLLRAGFRVTLLDAWGAGHVRSSSGDETRVIRSTYGANEFYFDLNVRALELWKEHQQQWNIPLFYNTGTLWLCHEEKVPIVDDSIPFARKHSMEYIHLTKTDLHRQYPILNSKDLDHAYLDPFGGYLMAREACHAVKTAFCNEGGQYEEVNVLPGLIHNGLLHDLRSSNGNTLKADSYLFACGSWLGQIFPDILGNVIKPTKQEIFCFGLPALLRSEFIKFPVWVDADGKDFYYGIPGDENRGFKVGVDKRGVQFDPTSGDHSLTPHVLAEARTFINHRFPSLKDMPLLKSRVCPYENSSDGNFIFETHPEASNVLFLGGGSGHGFKHGPALGELVARTLQGYQNHKS